MNSIDIIDIGTKKKDLPDPSTINFESLPTYLSIAKRIICKHANKIKPGLANEIMKNEDAISNIASNIIMGDWIFNGKGTLEGWRSQMGKWAIYNYITRADKRYKKSAYSLDSLRTFGDGHSSCYYDVLSKDDDEAIKTTDKYEVIKKLIDELMEIAQISDRQREVLRLHYLEGKSVNEIIHHHGGRTRQNVSILLQRGVAALTKAAKTDPKYEDIFKNEVLS